MKEKLAKLIDVKSIMTLSLTIVFCVLALCGVISGDQFITIFTVIVGFYFGTQAQKKADEAKPAGGYSGPEQGMADDPEYTVESVDAATVHTMHPPEQETDIVVTGFAG